jgi:PDDEXK-like domain of unknown function (DUF3799)
MSIVNLTAEQYHGDPAPQPSLSASIATILLDQSPLHAWLAHPKLNPRFQRETDSRFDLGSAAHMMLLEKREDAIVIVPHDDWRTNAAKKLREDAQAEGKYAILQRHYDDVVLMVAKATDFLATSELAGMFETATAEQTVIWQEGEYWFRCRPDLLSADKRVILDYKSTGSASHEAFGKQIGRLGYDLQAEVYTRGLTIVTGVEPAFVFLAQEITPPYACSLTALSNAYRAVGNAKVKRAMTIWKDCLRRNDWPSYTSQIAYVEPKIWDLTELEMQESL